MRSQWCREHIDETAKNCGLQKSVVAECQQAAAFCIEHSAFAECGSRAIVTLIRVKDDTVRERAISLAENALNVTTPSEGNKKTRLTGREIKKLIEQADLEVRTELTRKHESETVHENSPAAQMVTTFKEQSGDQHQTDSEKAALAFESVEPVGQNVIAPAAALALPEWNTACEWSPHICKSGKCPDGKTHYIKNSRRNRMECDLIGVEITQLPKNDCPWLVQQRKEGAAKSTTTSDAAEQISDVKQAEVDGKQLPVESIPYQQPSTSDKENVAVVHPIDIGQVEPVTGEVLVESPDVPLECSQHNIMPSVQVSDKPWMLPTRQLSQDELNEFFADFVRVACTVEQQQLITALIANGKFANEMAVVDYALDLVGKLDEAAKSFNIPHGQIPTSEQIKRYTFNPQCFAPVFPVQQPVNTKYYGTMPEISVCAVDIYVEYFSNDEVLP